MQNKEISTDSLSKEKFTEGTAAHNVIEKNPRKRKKHHFNSIRSQMEFYFGDANLSKDRFLKRLIETDPFVPLNVFLNFNKIKTLSHSVEEIAKALSNSQLLELDSAHQKVRRRTAIPVERNVDEKTLYVESLPLNTDHDWMRRSFERFGAVSYISLPKYTKSHKIKGFGFVEFAEESSVEKAVKAFKEFDGVLCTQQTDPAELASIQTYIKEQNNEEEDQIDAEYGDAKKLQKRRKISQEDEVVNQILVINETNAATELKTESETGVETAEDEPKAQSKSVKKRRKEKRAICAVKRKKDIELNTEAFTCDLKILPKRDWKRLRNKYLNLQRTKVGEIKRKAFKAHRQAEQQCKDSSNSIGEKVDPATLPSHSKKTKPNDRKLHRMNMNFYGAGESEEPPVKSSEIEVDKEVKNNSSLERPPLFSYKASLIVEVCFLEPCVNVKDFKADMRQYPAVKYIDVREGATKAWLRFETATAAENFVRQVSCAQYKCSVLAENAEKEYWQKIHRDREMKLNKLIKVPRRRGREKVKKLLTKHLYFCDEDKD